MALGAAPIRVVIFHGLAVEPVRVMQQIMELGLIALPEGLAPVIGHLVGAILVNVNGFLGHPQKGHEALDAGRLQAASTGTVR